MLPLLVSAVLCFFALFATLLVLLRRALRSGSLEGTGRRRSPARRRVPRQAGEANLPPGAGFQQEMQAGAGESLSRIVPGKRPDWRFMVSEHRRQDNRAASLPERKSPAPNRTSLSTRPDRAYFNADMGDLRDPYQAAEIPRRRRA